MSNLDVEALRRRVAELEDELGAAWAAAEDSSSFYGTYDGNRERWGEHIRGLRVEARSAIRKDERLYGESAQALNALRRHLFYRANSDQLLLMDSYMIDTGPGADLLRRVLEGARVEKPCPYLHRKFDPPIRFEATRDVKP